MATLTKRKFNQLVKDFEYGIIDSYSIDNAMIVWHPDSETCVEYINGKACSTGSFEHLLEWYLEAAE